jgi:hypothetical protein
MMAKAHAVGNGIKDRLSRSWDVTKQTFNVMMHDPEIFMFPVLATICSLIIFGMLLGPALMAVILGGEQAAPFLFYVGIFVFYFVVIFFSTFFDIGVVHIAKTRMEGGNATFMDGLRMAFSRLGKVIQWALLAATVGLLIKGLESKSKKKGGIIGLIGSLIAKGLGIAWAIVSTFVTPAIAIKNEGPFKALKSSALTIKKTWGESLVVYFGLGAVKGAVKGLLGIVLLVPAILAFFASPALGIVLLGLWVLMLTLVSIVFNAADTVFDTALFLYAETGVEPKMFEKEIIKHAFKPKQ